MISFFEVIDLPTIAILFKVLLLFSLITIMKAIQKRSYEPLYKRDKKSEMIMSDNFYNCKAGRVIRLWGVIKGSHLLLQLDYKKKLH